MKWLVIWVIVNVYPTTDELPKSPYAVYTYKTEKETKYQVFDSSQTAYDFVDKMPMVQGVMPEPGVLSYEIYKAEIIKGCQLK